MQWLITNWQLASAIAFGIVSEVVAVRQQLKYPDNDGFGGLLAGILKVLTVVKGGQPPASS